MFNLTSEQVAKIRYELQQQTTEAVNHYLKIKDYSQIELLETEINNVFVSVWQKHKLKLAKPKATIDIDPNNEFAVRIIPENDSAAIMMWGSDAYRDGATRK